MITEVQIIIITPVQQQKFVREFDRTEDEIILSYDVFYETGPNVY
jgi:hypothetical protein